MGQISGALGNVFGKMGQGAGQVAQGLPSDAANTAEITGDVAGQGAPTGSGLTGGQLFARKALSQGLGGLGRGLQNQPMQRGGGAAPINAPQAPTVDPAYFGGNVNPNKPKNGMGLPSFFGQ